MDEYVLCDNLYKHRRTAICTQNGCKKIYFLLILLYEKLPKSNMDYKINEGKVYSNYQIKHFLMFCSNLLISAITYGTLCSATTLDTMQLRKEKKTFPVMWQNNHLRTYMPSIHYSARSNPTLFRPYFSIDPGSVLVRGTSN